MSAPSLTLPAAAPVAAHPNRMPWYCIAVVLGAACAPIGVLWDISWHVTIGRDTFWTPAHMLIYLGGALPGSICGWLVLKQTFWTAPADRVPSVRLWGFYGPIGAWLVIWGAFAMIVSGPFDNWWHNAYGLDVQIVSPPHTVLALGTYSVAIGGLLMVVSWNNSVGADRNLGATLLVFLSFGILLTKVTVFTTEYTYPNHQHGATFYEVACMLFPLWLVIAARAGKLHWAATGTAGIYTAIMLGMVWLLPLFPAQPKLGPIYNPVNHMVPPPFPLLLIVPALGIDLVMRWLGHGRGFWRDTGLALLLGLLFFALLLAAQWPFANFLLSPGSRNRFFAGDAMWGYGAGLGDWTTRFWDMPRDMLTFKAAAFAVLFAAIHSRVALWVGNWFSSVKR